nr:hypothetical protein [Carboxydothermus islandicus]
MKLSINIYTKGKFNERLAAKQTNRTFMNKYTNVKIKIAKNVLKTFDGSKLRKKLCIIPAILIVIIIWLILKILFNIDNLIFFKSNFPKSSKKEIPAIKAAIL